ncbi:MAG: hypothetical protein RL660_426 [Bacteroidota bacterium]
MYTKVFATSHNGFECLRVFKGDQQVAEFTAMPHEDRYSFQQRANVLASDVIPDALNDTYLFSTTSNDLLVQIASGIIDPTVLAKEELARRGCDSDGKFIGFINAVKELVS